eukprot:g3515.t1
MNNDLDKENKGEEKSGVITSFFKPISCNNVVGEVDAFALKPDSDPSIHIEMALDNTSGEKNQTKIDKGEGDADGTSSDDEEKSDNDSVDKEKTDGASSKDSDEDSEESSSEDSSDEESSDESDDSGDNSTIESKENPKKRKKQTSPKPRKKMRLLPKPRKPANAKLAFHFYCEEVKKVYSSLLDLEEKDVNSLDEPRKRQYEAAVAFKSLSVAERRQLLQEKWKNIDDMNLAYFKKRQEDSAATHAAAMQSYQERCEKYNAHVAKFSSLYAAAEEEKKKASQKKAEKSVEALERKISKAPKRPKSAFFYFSAKERALRKEKLGQEKYKAEDKKERDAAIRSKWSCLSTSERVPYDNLASEDEKRYKKEVASIKRLCKKHGRTLPDGLLKSRTKESKKKGDKETTKKKKKKTPTKSPIKKKTKSKAQPSPKHIKKPKAAMSAYAFFAVQAKQMLQLADPSFSSLSAGGKSEQIKKEWETLSEEEKKYYHDQATADKVRYAKEKKRIEEEAKKETASPTKGKRPRSGYQVFFSERREQLVAAAEKKKNDNDKSTNMEKGPVKPSEMMKVIGQEWSALSAKEKEIYKQRGIDELDRKGAVTIDIDMPTRARSAYQFFSSDKRRQLRKAKDANFLGKNKKEQVVYLRELWKKMDGKELKHYDDQAAKDQRRYAREVNAYHSKVVKAIGNAKTPQKKNGKATLSASATKRRATTMPRRPISAFAHFSKVARPKAKEKHPEMESKDLTALIKGQFTALSPKEKKKYLLLEEKGHRKWALEMRLWNSGKLGAHRAKEKLKKEQSQQNASLREEKRLAERRAREKQMKELKLAKAAQRKRDMEIAALNSRYPIEDGLVQFEPSDHLDPLPKRPLATGRLTKVDDDNAGDLLMVWELLMKFSNVFRLSEFDVDDLIMLLSCDRPVPMTAEIHTSLLHLILTERPWEEDERRAKKQVGQSKEPAPEVKENAAIFMRGAPHVSMLTNVNWPAVASCLLAAVPKYHRRAQDQSKKQDLVVQLRQTEWCFLDVATKLRLLKLLCDVCMETEKVKNLLNHNSETQQRLLLENRRRLEQVRKEKFAKIVEARKLKKAKMEESAARLKSRVEAWEESGKKGERPEAGDSDEEKEEEDSDASMSEEDTRGGQREIVWEILNDAPLPSLPERMDSSSEDDDSDSASESGNDEEEEGFIDKIEHIKKRRQKIEAEKAKRKRKAERERNHQEYERALAVREKAESRQKEAYGMLSSAINNAKGSTDSRIQRLESAMDSGRAANLEGGTRRSGWRVQLMADAEELLKDLKKVARRHRKEQLALEKEAEEKRIFDNELAKNFVRTEALGRDRDFNCYWRFSRDKSRYRIFVQEIRSASRKVLVDASSKSILKQVCDKDIMNNDLMRTAPDQRKYSWKFYNSEAALEELIASLDDRGVRERDLKGNLKAFLRTQNGESDNSGDEQKMDIDKDDEESDTLDEGWREKGHEWIGKRVRRILPGYGVTDGKIVRWIPAGDDTDEEALWHMVHDDGDEEDLDEKEMIEALKNFENDTRDTQAPFLCYVNKRRDRASNRATFSSVSPGAVIEKLEEFEVDLVSHIKAEGGRSAVHGAAKWEWCKSGSKRSAWTRRIRALRTNMDDGETIREQGLSQEKSDSATKESATLLLELEEAIHTMQSEEDVYKEGGGKWQTKGHEFIGKKGLRSFEGYGTSVGTFTKFFLAKNEEDEEEGETSLFHILHEDLDEEDLDYAEALAAIKLYDEKFGTNQLDDDDKKGEETVKKDVEKEQQLNDENNASRWRTSGHAFIGKQARRFFVTLGKSDGKITKWMPFSKNSDGEEEEELFHMVHDDGDEEDLDSIEANNAINDFKSGETDGWITTGEKRIDEKGMLVVTEKTQSGKKTRRNNKVEVNQYLIEFKVLGFKESTKEDPALWHVRHTDGDEEDLERDELDAAIALYKKEKKKESVDDSDDDDDGSDEDVVDEKAPSMTLWPSLEARERWKSCLKNKVSFATISLALESLRDHAVSFGVLRPSGGWTPSNTSVSRSGRIVRKRNVDIKLYTYRWQHNVVLPPRPKVEKKNSKPSVEKSNKSKGKGGGRKKAPKSQSGGKRKANNSKGGGGKKKKKRRRR